MKCFSLLFFVLSVSFANAQLVGGDLVQSGRKLAEDFNFTLEESIEGVVFYRVAVNLEGKVTSVQLMGDKSIKLSTPVQVRLRTHLLSMKFEPGTHYPKFQNCEVKINLVKAN